jgi:hypothetical protein
MLYCWERIVVDAEQCTILRSPVMNTSVRGCNSCAREVPKYPAPIRYRAVSAQARIAHGYPDN